MRKKVVALTIREEIASATPKCFAKGEFGYESMWNTPWACFVATCLRLKNHTGKHACLHEVCIMETTEPTGRNVIHSSIEVHGEVLLILWSNKEKRL